MQRTAIRTVFAGLLGAATVTVTATDWKGNSAIDDEVGVGTILNDD